MNLSPAHLLETFGTAGLIIIIFVESSIFPLLPGDSLLFAAGLFASQGKLNIGVICLGTFAGAVGGNQISYLLGRKIGPKLFANTQSTFFKPKYLEKSEEFFQRRGPFAIVVARFVPIVRTYTAFVAGVSRMKYKTFVTFNVIGAFLWTTGILLVGYGLGKSLPDSVTEHFERFTLMASGLIIIASLVPLYIEWAKHQKRLGKSTNLPKVLWTRWRNKPGEPA